MINYFYLLDAVFFAVPEALAVEDFVALFFAGAFFAVLLLDAVFAEGFFSAAFFEVVLVSVAAFSVVFFAVDFFASTLGADFSVLSSSLFFFSSTFLMKIVDKGGRSRTIE